MAFEYFLYDTNFNNTLIDRGATSFAPLPPNTGEIFIDFLIPNTQPLYLYRESGSTIVLNDQATIDAYLLATDPPQPEDSTPLGVFTGYTGTTNSEIESIKSTYLPLSGGTIHGALNFADSSETGNTFGQVIEGSFGGLKLVGNVGINLESPYLVLPNASGFSGSYLTVGENGLITFTSVPSGGTTFWQDTNAGTVAIPQNTPTDLGVSVTINEDVQNGNGEWSITFDNTANQTNNIEVEILRDSTSVFSEFYSLPKNETGFLYGSIPFANNELSGSTYTLEITSTRSGIASDILLRVNKSFSGGGSGGGVWGTITGTLSDQTDLQAALDTKLNIIDFNIYSGETQSQIDALGVSNSLYAFAKTQSDGTLSDAYRLTVNKTGTGLYEYSFDQPVGTIFYGVNIQPFNTLTDTNGMVSNVSLSGFTVLMGEGDNGTTPDIPIDTEHSVSIYGVPVSGDTVINVVAASTFDSYTGTTDTRINENENDIIFLSGETDSKLNTSDFNSYSGITDTTIQTISAQTDTNTSNIALAGGFIIDNINDIAFLSGETDNKIDKVTGATGNIGLFNGIGNLDDSGILLSDISGATGPLKVVQARRTSTFSNIPLTWTDFDFEATDLENDDNVIEHDDVNRDDFLIKEDGLYMVSYTIILDDEGETRVRIDDSTVINGSIGQYGNIADAVDLIGNMPKTFVVNLNAGSKITLQVQANSGFENIFAESTIVIVKLDGIRGLKGNTGSGSNINILQDGILVSGSPFDGIDFSGATVTQDGSNAAVVINPPSSKRPLCQLIDSVGGQALNDVTPNPIEWGTQDIIDSGIFSHTAGQSIITVLENGEYEISFNVNGAGGINRSTVGVEFTLNGTAIAPTLTACYLRNTSNNDSTNTLPPFTLNLLNGDELVVRAFRLGDSTAVTSKAGNSFVKIKYIG